MESLMILSTQTIGMNLIQIMIGFWLTIKAWGLIKREDKKC